VQNVKDALRNVRSAWQQIGVNRTARRAAAENLRALQEREEKGEALTPEFLLDLKLQTQQRLANAQISELQAMVDYNIALTNLYQASGTLLKHNQIEMNWPEGIFAGNGETDWTDVEPPLRPAEGEEG
jgi:outer membrane protein TolC